MDIEHHLLIPLLTVMLIVRRGFPGMKWRRALQHLHQGPVFSVTLCKSEEERQRSWIARGKKNKTKKTHKK